MLNSSSDFGRAQANFEVKINAQKPRLFQNHGEIKMKQLSTEKVLVGDVVACSNFAPPLELMSSKLTRPCVEALV